MTAGPGTWLAWLHDRLLHHKLEVWGTVVLCALVCVSIAWLHMLHLNSLARATQGLQSIRLARMELARGMLAVALADSADSPFQLEQGMAQLRQAVQALERSSINAPQSSATLRFSLAQLQGSLAALQDPSVPQREKQTGLNIAYHALDRQAEALDVQGREDIAALALSLNREFRTALGISGGLLVGVVGLAILAGRARRHAESARRDMARRHEITLRSIGDGVIVADADGRVELLNPMAETLTGWTDAEARGRPLADVANIVPETNGQTVATIRDMLARGRSVSVLAPMLLASRDGTRRPVIHSVAPIRDGRGRPVGSVLVLRDRTEERQFQQALAESEQHYRTLANSGTALIWASDTEKLCTYFNDPWLRFTGRTLEEELGYGWVEGVHPEDLDRCIAIYAEAFDHREPFSMEYRLMHASGEYRWIVDSGGPRYDTQGEFLGYLGFCLDISERREAEAALRESEERFRTLADSAPEGIFIQIDGRFAYVNEVATRLFGAREQEELLGGHVPELFHPNCREQVCDRIRTLNQGQKQVPPAEEVILRLDGSSLDVEVAAVPFSLAGRNGALVFFHEVGSLKRAAEAMRQAKEAAESASLAKSEFLANMSHEIRTPLNGVLGMLQLMGTTSLTAEQQEYVTTALQSSRRLTRLLADILDLSRIESGKLSLQPAAFEVSGLEDAVRELFALAASEKGVALECHMAPDLPAVVVGDEARLRQILFNLVGNAVKFTQTGSVQLDMRPLPGRTDDTLRVLFCIRDTGIGMAESLLKTIFEPFSQAEAAYTRRFQGAGLGLSIVRKLVTLMEGELCIDSDDGRGTTAYLVLPFARLPLRDFQTGAATVRTQAQEDAYNGPPRVLFVEDDEVNSLAGVKLLEKLGYTPTAAMNGQEALELLAAHRFDVVLMDVQMPVLDGMATTRAIRTASRFRMQSRIPIIAMTAYAMTGDKDRFLAAGMDDYIAKPMDVDTLLRALERALSRSGASAAMPSAIM